MNDYSMLDDRELDQLIAERIGIEKCGFRCPVCRSSHFGTVNPLSGGSHIRSCHDEFAQYCRWKGPADQAIPLFHTLDFKDVEAQIIGYEWEWTCKYQDGKYHFDITVTTAPGFDRVGVDATASTRERAGCEAFLHAMDNVAIAERWDEEAQELQEQSKETDNEQ